MVVLKALISAGFLIQQRRKERAAAAPHSVGCRGLSCKPETTAVGVGELKTAKLSLLLKNNSHNFPTLIHQFSKFQSICMK